MSLCDECYSKAVEVLKNNITKYGFKASYEFYNSVWARDGSITVLGVLGLNDEELTKACKTTLEMLGRLQSKLGQIPNAIFLDANTVSWYAVDATAWWLIACKAYLDCTKDEKFLKEYWDRMKKAYTWLSYRDVANCGLISSPEAGDWMDSSVQRCNLVFYVNCLWYKASLEVKNLAYELGEVIDARPDLIKDRMNSLFWPERFEDASVVLSGMTTYKEFFPIYLNPFRMHYLNYLSYERAEDRCDVLANCLAILWDIADESKGQKITKYFFDKSLSEPYPIKVLNPPIFEGTYTWKPVVDMYRPVEWQNRPFCYHNAGIWPFVGGFYVMSLVKAGKRAMAEKELLKLAEANKLSKNGREWGFNEWLHGASGKPMGAELQSWSAACYVWAYSVVKAGFR